uniref:LisH domain-containing protein n=1 Tax=Romanomermis culicivorax TaxID=13658 RepID=A0A915KYZ1_ROMCU
MCPKFYIAPAQEKSTIAIRVQPKRKAENASDECQPLAPFIKRMKVEQNLSNSSWAEIEPYIIGKHRVFPLDNVARQRLILSYLASIGEYQEFLPFAFEHKAMELILYYIDLTKNKDVRLALDALKFLASLLCHKKFALEFVGCSGMEHLLGVFKQSMASAGVSLCLYYLAYNEDVMEKICLLTGTILDELVDYALWLLEHSYESGRCHATMFFTHAFAFRLILDRFDERDGLRRMINCLATLSILQVDESNNDLELSDDQVYTSRQTVRHVCYALRKYFESHAWLKVESLKRTHARNLLQLHAITDNNLSLSSIPSTKAINIEQPALLNCVSILLECVLSSWKPVDELMKLGGVTLLLQIVALSTEWNYTPKAEMVCSALIVLAICSVMQKVQLLLCETVTLPESGSTQAANILLGLAEGEMVNDAEVQKASLHVIVNCVCGPIKKYAATFNRSTTVPGGSTNIKQHQYGVLQKVWDCFRLNNGIMVLRNLLFVKTPLSEADSVRALACKALDGLARSDIVKQILSKMPLISNSQLHMLMREPILPDKRSEHKKFVEYARSLIERVTDKPITDFKDLSHERLEKASIVAHTNIAYSDKELFQLIYDHLLHKGMKKTASMLLGEADLPSVVPPKFDLTPTKATPILNRTPQSLSRHITPLISNQSTSSPFGLLSSKINLHSSALPPTSQSHPIKFLLPAAASTSTTTTVAVPQHAINPIASATSTLMPVISTTPSRLVARNLPPHNANSTASSSTTTNQNGPSTTPRPGSPSSIPSSSSTVGGGQTSTSHLSLDSIVKQYCRNQHAMCRNPVVTCPPFSLLQHHQCPEPKFIRSAPSNFCKRLYQRPIFPVAGGYDGYRCDLRHVFSRFKPIRVYKDEENEETFTCCSFSVDNQFLLLGTYAGDVKWYNLTTGAEESSLLCHSSALTSIEQSKDGNLLLTSSAYVKPYSALWTIGESLEPKLNFMDDYFVEFSKCVQDRIVGTNGDEANVYDISTGQSVVTLYDSDLANHYTKNKACFHPNDELVLSDGILWDIRSRKVVHKFDKLNPNISAVYQVGEEDDYEGSRTRSPLGSSFRTFDAADYSLIATVDIKKNISDLCVDKSDMYMAIIENQGKVDDLLSLEENVCRLYEVGRQRDDDEEFDDIQDEEVEDEENDDLSDLDDLEEELLNAEALEDEDAEESDDDDEDDDGGALQAVGEGAASPNANSGNDDDFSSDTTASYSSETDGDDDEDDETTEDDEEDENDVTYDPNRAGSTDDDDSSNNLQYLR